MPLVWWWGRELCGFVKVKGGRFLSFRHSGIVRVISDQVIDAELHKSHREDFAKGSSKPLTTKNTLN